MADETAILADQLRAYKMPVLKQMGQAAGIQAKRKDDLALELAKALPKPQRVQQALTGLKTRERAALDHLIGLGGLSSREPFKALLLRERLITPTPAAGRRSYYNPNPYYEGDPHRRDNKACFEDVLAYLTVQGLVLSSEALDYNNPLIDFAGGMTVFIPPPILAQLPPVQLDEARPVPQVQRIASSSARTFQRDLYLYWSFARRQPLSLNLNGSIRKTLLKQLNDTLLVKTELSKGQGEQEQPRLLFLRKLALALGLMNVAEGALQAVESPELFSQPPAERVQRSFHAWRDDNLWNELEQVAGAGNFNGGQTVIPEGVGKARRSVLSHMTALESDGWVGLDDLIDRIRTRDYGFLFPRNKGRRGSYYSYNAYHASYNTVYYGANNPYGWTFEQITDEATGWETIEAGFIRSMVEQPLYWLGLVDLGQLEDGQVIAYRLTPMGRWLVGRSEQPEVPAEGGRVVVQPNFTVLAIDPVSDIVLAALDQFAERKSAERAIEYLLTRQSVYRGQKAGWQPDKIRQWLEETSGAPLPANVGRSLDEWAALQGQIVIHRRVDVLQTADSQTLGSVQQIPEAASYLERPLSPVAMLLAPNSAGKLQQTLQAHSILPMVTGDRSKARRPSVYVDEAGSLTFTLPVPSIYLYDLLAAFSEAGEDGYWAITQASVQRAIEAGWTAPRILEQLRAVHIGPLPAAFERRLLAWAKHYGDAHLHSNLLVQLRDPQVLSALRADPELAPLLKPMPNLDLASTVEVSPKNLARLKELLAERGIDLY